jgi:uncharacterized membrane protein YgdD (TMEM256/DUF423 family)
MEDRRQSSVRLLLAVGGFYAFLAVALGAFGAHGLRARLTPEMLDVYKTGVTYHMWHALAILMVALAADRAGDPKRLVLSGWLLAIGIVLFSGSLYALALTNVRIVGAITPLGGLCFLTGWLLFTAASLRRSDR